MKPTHLACGGDDTWCGDDEIHEITYDPREATCIPCLQKAGSYGAAAAMRCAAVEAAGAVSDPEIEKERDHAIRELQKHRRAVAAAGAFVCADCNSVKRLVDAKLEVGEEKWCIACYTRVQIS